MLSFFRRAPRVVIERLPTGRAEDCARIHQACFAHPWSATDIEALVASSAVVGHGAIDDRDDRMLGFVISRLVLEEGEILTIAVDPGARNGGVARELLSVHLSDLALARVQRVFLEVDEGNKAALALYHGARFTQVGRREGYYKAETGRANALIMKKDLI